MPNYEWRAWFTRTEKRATRIYANEEVMAKEIAVRKMERVDRLNPREWKLERVERVGEVDESFRRVR